MLEKVTRDVLREMRIGESQAFKLPDAAAFDSARSTASQMQRHLGCRFKLKSDYENHVLILTKHGNV